MPCNPGFLANIRMFELLNEDDRQALAQVVDELTVPAGHTCFRQAIPAIHSLSCAKAPSNCSSKIPSGKKSMLTLAESGDMFGELAMLDSVREPRQPWP